MTRSRRTQISLEATSYYHVVSRCVRRAYLCGQDRLTGKSFEYRRQQIEDDALRLCSIFYIDIAAFAILSTHYHLVLHVDQERCLSATGREIVQRWHRHFAGTELSRKFANGEDLDRNETDVVNSLIDTWRARLHDISWLMKVLNEGIARRANKDDDCKGHFWEARFKSQALLDEKAILSAMAYVDLNPIRAAMATTPENSDHTSIKLRIEHWRNKTARQTDRGNDADDANQPATLLPFTGNTGQLIRRGIAYSLTDYIDLVDWTGRQIRDDKSGSIPEDTPHVLARLDIAPQHWVHVCQHFESRFKRLVGSVASLDKMIGYFGLKRKSNARNSSLLFG